MTAKTLGAFLVVILTFSCITASAMAASALGLAPDLSFTDDSSSKFPITGINLGDATPARDRATIIFFGTAHCWNTNREAERLVSLYPKYRDKVDFIIVDLSNPSSAQRSLIARYYHGYIPTITVLSSDGRVIYDRAGETADVRGDTSRLEALINSAK